jgi:protein-tyrosine-phosphatase
MRQQTQDNMTLLFVCTGNSCRSPMAAALFADMCRRRGIGRQVHVYSAGTAAPPGGVSRQAKAVLTELAIPLLSRTTRMLDPEAVAAANLIVTMTEGHRQTVIGRFPEAGSKTETLMSFAGSRSDIDDPYGGSIAEYQECLDQMRPGLDGLLRYVEDQLTGAAGNA